MDYKITYIERGTEEVKSVRRDIPRKDNILTWLNATAGMNVRMFTKIQTKNEADREAWDNRIRELKQQEDKD